MKKVLSFILALTLVLALAVPAFATDTELDASTLANGATIDYTTSTEVGTISVTVPSSGEMKLNPYGLSITVGSDSISDPVISPLQFIVSDSDSKIKVSAAVTGTVSGNAKLATATTVNADPPLTTNSVFLQFATQVVADASVDPADFAPANKLVVSSRATVTDLGVLDNKTDATKVALAFKLMGDAVTNPKVAWTANDKVAVSVAFSFAPADANATVGDITPTP